MTALPPKPTHNFFPLRFSPPRMVSTDERHEMIAREAYVLAERRRFEPGHEIADWAAAEALVNVRLANERKLTGLAGW